MWNARLLDWFATFDISTYRKTRWSNNQHGPSWSRTDSLHNITTRIPITKRLEGTGNQKGINPLVTIQQLAGRGTEERTLTWMVIFLPELFYFENYDVSWSNNCFKPKKTPQKGNQVSPSLPDSLSFSLGRTEWLGLTTLHSAQQVALLCRSTFLKCSSR